MSSLRLLVLEDSQLDAELLLREVRSMDQEFEVRIVSKKEEFQREVISWKPELIISDFNLQTFKGDEALIYAKEKLPNSPFITLSGSVTKEMELGLLKNRANDVIRKDNLKKLPYVIKRVLHEKEDQERLKKTLNELENNLKFQEALAQIALMLNSREKFSEKISHSLSVLGDIADVSRVYIFEDFEDGAKTRNTYEWCAEGVISQINESQDFSYQENIPSWRPHLLEKGRMHCSDINELPEDLQEVFKAQDIKSLIVYPIMINSIFFGFIGFDEVRRKRKWTASEDKLLKSVSGLISNAYSEERAMQKLQDSNKKLTELLKEKEALVGEVHHRVKNNLALISSFLQLDQMGIGSLTTTEEIVSANILRIKSIAIIHELVYQDGTFSNISITKTLEKILAESFSEKRGIKLDLRVEEDSKDAFFNINIAVPFSLMISEIMFQVFSIQGLHKYEADQAFAIKIREQNGLISVSLIEKNLVELLSKLQEGKGYNFSDLIDVLSKQIGAKLFIEEKKQTARIEFRNRDVKGSSTAILSD